MAFNDGWIKRIPLNPSKKFETVKEFKARGGKITKCKKIKNTDWAVYTKPKQFKTEMI